MSTGSPSMIECKKHGWFHRADEDCRWCLPDEKPFNSREYFGDECYIMLYELEKFVKDYLDEGAMLDLSVAGDESLCTVYYGTNPERSLTGRGTTGQAAREALVGEVLKVTKGKKRKGAS